MDGESIINRYTNCEVEVFYLTDGGQYRDKGTLCECDREWMTLRKPGNELFLIPVTAVRIVKVLNPPKSQDSVLLRPAEPDSDWRLSSKQ